LHLQRGLHALRIGPQLQLPLDFGCAKDRQYELLYELYDSSWKFVRNYYDHYPRNTEWTTDTDIDLGNIGRFFE
jgi:hypothetical protein